MGLRPPKKANNGVRGIRPPSRQITTNDDGDGGEYNDNDLRQSGFGPGGNGAARNDKYGKKGSASDGE
jgi:hypothetical protein